MSKSSNSLTFKLLCWFLYVVCWLLKLTWRVRYVGLEERSRANAAGPYCTHILAVFHENAIAGILTHVNQGVAVLASRSKDGEMVSFVSKKVGLFPVRGSSSRGGREARDELVERLKSGMNAAITVDGPKGPRRIPKAGIVDISRKTGSPIVPIICLGRSYWTLAKAWDQTRIAKPFTKILVLYRRPILVPKDLTASEFERLRALVGEELEMGDSLASTQFDELWSQGARQL